MVAAYLRLTLDVRTHSCCAEMRDAAEIADFDARELERTGADGVEGLACDTVDAGDRVIVCGRAAVGLGFGRWESGLGDGGASEGFVLGCWWQKRKKSVVGSFMMVGVEVPLLLVVQLLELMGQGRG